MELAVLTPQEEQQLLASLGLEQGDLLSDLPTPRMLQEFSLHSAGEQSPQAAAHEPWRSALPQGVPPAFVDYVAANPSLQHGLARLREEQQPQQFEGATMLPTSSALSLAGIPAAPPAAGLAGPYGYSMDLPIEMDSSDPSSRSNSPPDSESQLVGFVPSGAGNISAAVAAAAAAAAAAATGTALPWSASTTTNTANSAALVPVARGRGRGRKKTVAVPPLHGSSSSSSSSAAIVALSSPSDDGDFGDLLSKRAKHEPGFRKVRHKQTEDIRRHRINGAIEELRVLLNLEARADKASVLEMAKSMLIERQRAAAPSLELGNSPRIAIMLTCTTDHAMVDMNDEALRRLHMTRDMLPTPPTMCKMDEDKSFILPGLAPVVCGIKQSVTICKRFKGLRGDVMWGRFTMTRTLANNKVYLLAVGQFLDEPPSAALPYYVF